LVDDPGSKEIGGGDEPSEALSCAAMPPAGSLPFDVLLQGLRRDAEESGPDEASGRDLPGHAVLRRPPDGPDASPGGTSTGESSADAKMGLEVYRR
jgi:hypothetical protein